MVDKIETRQVKVIYGGYYVTQHTYKKGDKILGYITKNPHTELYVVQKADYINAQWLTKEFKRFKDARKFVLKK